MAAFPIEIPPGIVLDDTSYRVGSQAWRDAEKVRWVRGLPEVIGGWERLQLDPLSGVCRAVLGWSDGEGGSYIAFGTHTGLFVNFGGELLDITPAGLSTGAEHGTGGAGFGTGAYSAGEYSEPSTANFFPRTWALANWGASLMANPRGGPIYWSTDAAAEAAASGAPVLTNAPVNVGCIAIAEQRQVIAYGCNEELSGDFNPMCIRVSDIEDPEQWATASDNNAYEVVLEGGGRIVRGETMGPRQVCWSDKNLYVGTFIGDPGQTWRFELVAGGAGLAGAGAAVVRGQRAYWITPAGKLMGYALGGEPQEIPSPVLGELWTNLATGQADKIVASTFSTANEIRFDYPDARDGEGLENSRYVSFTVGEGASALSELAWSRGTMARTAYVDAGPQGYPIGVDPAGVAYWHERGRSDNGARFRAWVETADLYAGDGGGHVFCSMMTPDFHGQLCPVSITWIGRSFPQSQENQGASSPSGRNYGPFVSAPGAELVPMRAEGRLVRLRFESYSASNYWRFGRPVFEMQPTGSR